MCVSVRVPAVGKLLNKFSNSVFFFFLHFVVGWACSKASWEEGAILKAAHQLNRSWLADNTQRDTPTCTHKKKLERNGFGIYELLYSQLEMLVCVCFSRRSMKECLPPGQHVRVPPVRTASYPQYVGHTNTLKTVFEACVCMWHFSRERLQQTYFHSHTLVNHSADTHMQRKHADKSECYHTHVNTNTCKRLSWKARRCPWWCRSILCPYAGWLWYACARKALLIFADVTRILRAWGIFWVWKRDGCWFN